MAEELPPPDVVQLVGGSMGRGGPLSLKLEDDHTRVVARGQQILRAVGGQDPEPVSLPPEGLDADALGHVPDADAAILRVGNDEVMLGMKEAARDVVGM